MVNSSVYVSFTANRLQTIARKAQLYFKKIIYKRTKILSSDVKRPVQII